MPADPREQLEELVRQAWTLTDAEIDSIQPGNIGQALSLLDAGPPLWTPFADRTRADLEAPDVHLIGLMRKPEFFPWTCRHLFGKPDGSGPLELLPFQHLILLELWWRQFPMLIGTRGLGKSFALALYILLRLIFTPGAKVVIVASAFRQAKVVFEYMERIWYASPVLRDVIGGQRSGKGRENGPRRDIDRCEFVIGDSVAVALPMSDGKKIRGLRANYVVSEEFASIPEEVYAVVVQGFGAVTADPVQNVKDRARMRLLQRLGMWTADMDADEAQRVRGNQSILSGTAYYAFNHFCRYWREYRDIINTRGDPAKIEEVLKGPPPEGWDWRDYSVIRIPYGLIPKGYMDDKTIARARQTTHSSSYLMEYEACQAPGTPVVTARGLVPIERVAVGDMVLTHRGRFRPVTGVTRRPYAGDVVRFVTRGHPAPVVMTVDHPVWRGGDEWAPAGGVDDVLLEARLSELSGRDLVRTGDWVSDYYETPDGELLYPIPSQARLSLAEVRRAREMRAAGSTFEAIGAAVGVSCAAAQAAVKNHRRPKNAVPAGLPLGYDLGLVIGYYASEGSIGAKGRAAFFSLDGHVDVGLAELVACLVGALERTFGFSPRVYRQGAVANVTVNSRLVAEFLSGVCPGLAHEKRVDPDVLFSNPDFLRGFLVGFWNGDGHKSEVRSHVIATTTSPGLAAQLRLALSYFGVGAGLRKVFPGTTTIKGKTYPARDYYQVYAGGPEGRRLRRLLTGRGDVGKPNSRSCRVLDDRIEWRMAARSVERYDGPVINLHVHEDESYSLPNATVHNCFANDSEGFFKRSLIERCVVGNPDDPSPPAFPSCGPVRFAAAVTGDPGRRYVYGVDPASESDSFAVVVVERWADHRRVVFCWTTRKGDHREKLKRGVVKEHDFYRYCVRKLRDLMKVFPCERMLVDAGGGGVALREAFRDPDKLEPGELPVYEAVDPDPKGWKETDDLPGAHLLELVVFRDNAWVCEANHGMKKDLEDRVLLFPPLDGLALGLAMEDDKEQGRVVLGEDGEQVLQLYDTLENCMLEIEELKKELSTIVISSTPTGLERWDTPDTKVAGAKKGRMRKDRYSALLMANMGARLLARQPAAPAYEGVSGGFAGAVAGRGKEDGLAGMYKNAPAWVQAALRGAKGYGTAVRRGGVRE